MVAACVMTFEARDSAAKVTPARPTSLPRPAPRRCAPARLDQLGVYRLPLALPLPHALPLATLHKHRQPHAHRYTLAEFILTCFFINNPVVTLALSQPRPHSIRRFEAIFVNVLHSHFHNYATFTNPYFEYNIMQKVLQDSISPHDSINTRESCRSLIRKPCIPLVM